MVNIDIHPTCVEATDGAMHSQAIARSITAVGSSSSVHPDQQDCASGPASITATPDVGSVGAYWKDPRSSPHVAQACSSSTGYAVCTDLNFDRLLRTTAPRAPYRRRRGERKSVVHWGQRKLLLMEIEFLTRYARLGHPVVYAGAAPGTHIKFLVSLFPNLHFVLFDPAPFHRSLHDLARVELRQELFTNETASELADTSPLFISDVRHADWELFSAEEMDAHVAADMASQRAWHLCMRPLKSMLKFRLPWSAGSTQYLAGDVVLQPFGPVTTTETRLLPYGEEEVSWSHEAYMEQMFHFNTQTRVTLYPHVCTSERARRSGLDHCYDCTAEVYILTEYLSSEWAGRARGKSRCDRDGDADFIVQSVARMSEELSRACGIGRSLAHGNMDPAARKHGMQRRQYAQVDGEAICSYDAAVKRQRVS